MAKKSPKIFLLVFFSLIVLNFDFETISTDFSPVGHPSNPIPFISKAQAKKRRVKRKARKVKKLSKKEIGENVEIPIAISGDEICQRNSKEALRMLFDKDKEDFYFVASNLGKIECVVSGSGVYSWETPPRFKVGVATSNAGPIWYAGVLVHESCHIEQFKKNGGQSQPGDAPKEEYSGEKAEIACLGAQLAALKKLEASQPKIDYVANIAQSRYWLVDNSKRWW